MRYLSAGKRDLLELFQGSRPMRSYQASESIEHLDFALGDLLLLWPDAEVFAPLPPIIVHNESPRQVLAWMATYLPVKPLTSVCRLIERSQIRLVSRRVENVRPAVGMALVGAILGETAIRGKNLDSFSLTEALQTYSFMAARSAICLPTGDSEERLRDRWFALHRASNSRWLVGSGVLQAWVAITQALGPWQTSLFRRSSGELVVDGLRELINSGSVSTELWRRLDLSRADLDFGSKTVEDRIRLFAATAAKLRQTGIPENYVAFVLAFAANQVLPGSMDHVGLLKELGAMSDSSVIWYGFIAGLTGGSRIGSLQNGLGWRLHRDVTVPESAMDATRADIAVDELEVLMDHESTRATIRTAGELLKVELQPCVYSYVPWLKEARLEANIPNRDPIVRLDDALTQAREALREIRRDHGASEPARTKRKRT